MINELFGLAKTLEHMDIEVYEWHREYKPLPKVTNKAPCIRIWLDDDGNVCDFESINAELANFSKEIWK